MNGKSRNAVFAAAAAMGICLSAAASALADAWSAAWGRADVTIIANDPDSVVHYNADPNKWYIDALGDAVHSNSWHDFAEYWELYGNTYPPGEILDGTVTAEDVLSTDGLGWASVERVTVNVASTGGPFIDINEPYDVYSYAESPSSAADAEGIGEHDDLFWIEYTGPGDPPASTSVTVRLIGDWNLEGATGSTGESWWALWYAHLEVYDPSTGDPLDYDADYHDLEGGSADSDSGTTLLEFTIDIPYDTDYALWFWLDSETHAENPSPGHLCPTERGDVNGDAVLNNFDITAFVYSVTHTEAEFENQYPAGHFWCADCNEDDAVNNFDIGPFVALLAAD
ncbi:MAG: hypothetical protein PVJ57_23095 [Phycisphaerae bacterium]|jgi:hypothetical protein